MGAMIALASDAGIRFVLGRLLLQAQDAGTGK